MPVEDCTQSCEIDYSISFLYFWIDKVISHLLVFFFRYTFYLALN